MSSPVCQSRLQVIVVIPGINMEGALYVRNGPTSRPDSEGYEGTWVLIHTRTRVPGQTELGHDPCNSPKLMKSRAARPVPHHPHTHSYNPP